MAKQSYAETIKQYVNANLHNSPIAVFHQQLQPLRQDGDGFARECPFCPGGILAGRRGGNAHILKQDRCNLCGQEVCYRDVEEG